MKAFCYKGLMDKLCETMKTVFISSRSPGANVVAYIDIFTRIMNINMCDIKKAIRELKDERCRYL